MCSRIRLKLMKGEVRLFTVKCLTLIVELVLILLFYSGIRFLLFSLFNVDSSFLSAVYAIIHQLLNLICAQYYPMK